MSVEEMKAALSAAVSAGVVSEADYKARGYHLEVALAPEQVRKFAEASLAGKLYLEDVTAVDWMADGQMEVLYHLCSFDEPLRVIGRCRIDRFGQGVPTISDIYEGANWHERETHEMYGIGFTGHPYLKQLLLPEDADFHPLRKDF